MEDIAPALLEQIKELYKNEKDSSIKIKNILDKLKEKNANFVDASEYANELGEILSKVFGDTFSVEVLPDGKMYFNIAKRTVEPAMKALQTDIADLTEELQENLNKQAGLGIKPLRPELNQDKIDGIIDRLAEAETYDDIKWILQEPVKTFARSVVDDAILTNAEFHGKSGLAPKIIRRSSGNCCKWCTNLVGEYNYPNVPKDVYRRHNRCRCTVDYVVGKRKQNVWTKAWADEVESEKIDNRKVTGIEKDSKNGIMESENICESCKRLESGLKRLNVEYNEVRMHGKPLADEEIIKSLAGGDKTRGSCASVGLAYIGQKQGMDVLDFRGGESQNFFSTTWNLREISKFPNVVTYSETARSNITAGNKLLKKVEKGKEYYFVSCRHAAIVRKTEDDVLQYLELQSATRSGWTNFDGNPRYTLKTRFGGSSRSYNAEAFMIDIDSCKDSDDIKRMLAYINTNEAEQKKGATGSVK